MKSFKDMQLFSHPGPADTQHDRQELMSQHKFVFVDPVMAHEQPARQSLRQRIAGVGKSSVGKLDLVALRIAEQEPASLEAFFNDPKEIFTAYSHG
jgi:hypothetical protein